ncbi:family 4 glycosyl hydrolase [Pseudonocardia sichuanensis]|uniref:6-phospho-beta-glucosidase n=1 Tax=Pseudonocardia kunmingensis TaxID=630975 RepID=A0A543CY49_9PSEU|nr:6-phospho-beta-glucosidase [Pseudonocardia kunmingensis]TQM02032.1 6-phospho-beta-glucosidase [Pseudonocardia kunmingensis]
MKLTILGGGGFRVPLVYRALASGSPITEVVLHDVSGGRLAAIRAVLAQLATAPAVRTTTDLDDALADARFVFSAIRVDGLAGRTVDERVALSCGVLGQETTGPGGIAFGLRTVPVALRVAERVAAVAPDAWVINFTNPAGMITEAMQRVLGERVIGICDSPIGLAHRAARALSGLGVAAAEEPVVEYVGLNHLGWLRGLRVDGVDRLPDLLADDAALASVEEARLVGPDWVRAIGALPNEYLYYFYRTRDAVAAIGAAASTRGEYLLDQQDRFYADTAADPGGALERWIRVHAERDASYMAESREASGAGERAVEDLAVGGYQQVALDLMAALSGGASLTHPAGSASSAGFHPPSRTMILDVRNGAAVPGLPADAVVEVPCLVGAHGVTPLATAPLPLAMLGLLQQVKAVEQDTIEAAVTGSEALALRAFAQHPLVDSVGVAQELLRGYRARIPGVAAVFGDS